MKTGQINIIVLEPDDGYVLTNGETYSKKVYLGTADRVENWREVSEEEMREKENGHTDTV